MQPQFLDLLPSELHATVQELEQRAGCEIDVVRDAAASDFDNVSFGVVDGACCATIAYRGNEISRCALLHEVLHLKRYWLDAVPMLRPIASYRELEARALDGFLEHLVIIPQEQRFAEAESNAHWSAVLRAFLSGLPRTDTTSSYEDVLTLRRGLLLHRAMLDIALPHIDGESLHDRLRQEDLLEASGAFVERLRGMLDDKMRMLLFTAQEFRYDLKAFCVGRYDLSGERKSIWRSDALVHLGQ